MAETKRKNWILLGIPFFVLYLFIASVPIPKETVLENRWLVSVAEAGTDGEAEPDVLPVRLGDRLAYVDSQGRFSVNKRVQGYAALSDTLWSEYGPTPEILTIQDRRGEAVAVVSGVKGYPALIEGRVFIVAPEQQALTALDSSGSPLWSYEFSSPLIALDATADLVVAACIDGSMVVLNMEGKANFTFEPGGSRLPIILAARITKDGKRIALISGIDAQRFLLLERFGISYKVVHHEFLGEGFRRPIHLAFVNEERKVLFEREGGIGIYDIQSGKSALIPMDGRLVALDGGGKDGNLHVIGASGDKKFLMGIGGTPAVAITAPFVATSSFIRRSGELLYIGGDGVLAAFALREK